MKFIINIWLRLWVNLGLQDYTSMLIVHKIPWSNRYFIQKDKFIFPSLFLFHKNSTLIGLLHYTPDVGIASLLDILLRVPLLTRSERILVPIYPFVLVTFIFLNVNTFFKCTPQWYIHWGVIIPIVFPQYRLNCFGSFLCMVMWDCWEEMVCYMSISCLIKHSVEDSIISINGTQRSS